MSLTLGNGLMRAAEPTLTQEKPNAPEGRFIDAHVHFHDRNAGNLDKIAEWLKANNVQRIINQRQGNAEAAASPMKGSSPC